MPIYFAVVARGCVILAKYATMAGNFTEVIQQVLVKIPSSESSLTYKYESFCFHYIRENDMIYMCVADEAFNRPLCFAFLRDVQRRFTETYGDRMRIALPYGMNSDFSVVLARQMRQFNDPSASPRLQQVDEQMTDLKNIMVRNIDALVDRGQKLEFLIDRSEQLEASTLTFRERGHSMVRKFYWKNIKWTVAAVLVVACIIFIVITVSCGGFGYPHCRST